MKDGVVHGICVSKDLKTLVVVPNDAPEKPSLPGFPGGIAGSRETPEEAMVREWREEVWGHGTPNVKFFMKIKKNGRNGSLPHYQYLFLVEDTGREMRKSGVKGETRAPVRVDLWEVVKGNIDIFFSHKIALLEFLKARAKTNKTAAFMAIMLAKKMGVEI